MLINKTFVLCNNLILKLYYTKSLLILTKVITLVSYWCREHQPPSKNNSKHMNNKPNQQKNKQYQNIDVLLAFTLLSCPVNNERGLRQTS